MDPILIKKGNPDGGNAVVELHTAEGTPVYAIGVPMGWENRLGPTWAYFIETDKPTLIDTGNFGSIHELQQGLKTIGRSLSDIKRFVITHGHMDHDGNSHDIIDRGGAELWAHEVFGSLLKTVNRPEQERLLQEKWKVAAFAPWDRRDIARRGGELEEYEHMEWRERQERHQEVLSHLSVDRSLRDGDEVDGFRFIYAPGHSPDELCIIFEGLLFSGDHILPKVTPHPSMNFHYGLYKDALPESYRHGNEYYGLRVYLESLKKVEDLQQELTIMPAHRLYFNGEFNILGLERAREIASSHLQRCHDIIGHLKAGPKSLLSVTERLFNPEHLEGSGFFMGMTELLCHIELLQDTGDVDLVERERKVLWKGTTNFVRFFSELGYH